MVKNNTEVFYGSFEDYLQDIQKLIVDNCKSSNEIGWSIRHIGFTCEEIEPNFQYFRDCYDDRQTPEDVLKNIKYNEDELFRKISNISDESAINIINDRCLGKYCLDYVYTDDLEDEISTRWDCSMIKEEELSTERMLEIIKERGDSVLNKPLKILICEALGFSNHFTYTKDEIIEELIKKL